LEPVYKVDVSVPTQWVGEVSNIISRKRGKITSSEQKGPITTISSYIPVGETFGLAADMRSATAGHAFWQSSFDHWEKMPENAALNVIKKMRDRKGLPPEIPTAESFIREE
jgi:elongation factor 2